MAKRGRAVGWSLRGEKGGRPKGQHPEKWQRKTIFVSTTISGYPEEIYTLKERAKENDKSVSRFVLEALAK